MFNVSPGVMSLLLAFTVLFIGFAVWRHRVIR
jgi:hypothetical protein